jgi:hypothetical protein
MSYSKEWTEWHLTPAGWLRGSERTDGVGVELKPDPEDRVLTKRWTEEQSSPYSSMERYETTIWRSGDEEAIKRYLEQYGDFPGTL